MAGYGSEVWCTDEVVSGRTAFGATAVMQAAYRRLTTPRGDFWFLVDGLGGGTAEEAYGLDVSGFLGSVGPETAALALPTLIRGELLKDDRIENVRATVEEQRLDGPTSGLVIRVFGELAGVDETFAFTLGIDDVTTEILGYG